jgi:tetratricopeptide (TPR) repeat protein
MTATKTDIQQLTECCICCICSDYVTELRETPCCHQLFCLTCIQSYLNQSVKDCPLCKRPSLTEDSLLTNVVVQRLVDNLQLDCPYKLEGCQAKVPRCDLIQHKQSCEYSPEKLANKKQEKINELKPLLRKYNDPKSHVNDKTLYDLAKSLHEQHAYAEARQCFEKMKTRNSFEAIFLQAQIERDDGQFDEALRLYNQLDSLEKSIPQLIELLLAEGHTFFEMAKYTEANDAFTRALHLLSNDNSSRTQKKAEILNAIGRVAKKCSDVSILSFIINFTL